MKQPGRRDFLRDAGAGLGAAWAWLRPGRAAAAAGGDAPAARAEQPLPTPAPVRVVAEGFPQIPSGEARPLDLAPARWLWLPSQRTLANTFVLFRRELELAAAPVRATGWITADSRYRLSVNGVRV